MAISTIRDLANPNLETGYRGSPWRQRLMPAHFDGFPFHVESSNRENGRRIVTHEFPKKELPYSEDMGRRAIEFSVRGYIIQYSYDTGEPLYQRDYTQPRDQLISRLELGTPGPLQLPTLAPIVVVCSRYRLTEEERLGGYCVIDMSFVELGVPPFSPIPDTLQNLIAKSEALANTTLAAIAIGDIGTIKPITTKSFPQGVAS